MESEVLHAFHNDNFVLWKTSAPNCVLALLKNTQLAESLRIWYLYRDTVKDNLGYGNYHLQDLVWWNGNIRLKTKKFLEKVYFRSQILEHPSIGEYWNIFGVPVLPENFLRRMVRAWNLYFE